MKIRKRRVILGAIVLAVLAAGGWYWYHTTTDEYKARQLVKELRQWHRRLDDPGPGTIKLWLIDLGLMKEKEPRDPDEIEEDLVAIGEPAVPALIEALKDESWYVRTHAAMALGRIGPAAKEGVPALIQALKDEDAEMRIYAALVLEWIGPVAKAAVPDLIQALKDESISVRAHAAGALVVIDSTVAESEVISVLNQGLKDGDWENRHNAAVSLGRIGPSAKAAIPALREALKDEDEQVRQAVAKALKKVEAKAEAE